MTKIEIIEAIQEKYRIMGEDIKKFKECIEIALNDTTLTQNERFKEIISFQEEENKKLKSAVNYLKNYNIREDYLANLNTVLDRLRSYGEDV